MGSPQHGTAGTGAGSPPLPNASPSTTGCRQGDLLLFGEMPDGHNAAAHGGRVPEPQTSLSSGLGQLTVAA